MQDIVKVRSAGAGLVDTGQGNVRRQGKDRKGKGGGMMLAKRIIPCLDVDNGRVVKGVKFAEVKDAGDPVELAEKIQGAGRRRAGISRYHGFPAGERHHEKCGEERGERDRHPLHSGRRNKETRRRTRHPLSGADKVSINTAAVKNPELVTQLMSIFGKQCVVVAIDAKRNYEVKGQDNIQGQNRQKILV